MIVRAQKSVLRLGIDIPFSRAASSCTCNCNSFLRVEVSVQSLSGLENTHRSADVGPGLSCPGAS